MTKVSFEAVFDGKRVKKDGIAYLNFKIAQLEMGKAIRVITFLERIIRMGLAVGDQNIRVGDVTFYSMKLDRHGELTLVFESDINSLVMGEDALRDLINKNITVMLACKLAKVEGEG